MAGTDVISYIVSVYDRMKMLNACLASIDANPEMKEVFVCCNSTSSSDMALCGTITSRYHGAMERTGFDTDDCYKSANLIAPKADGDWLCFPSDDSLYVADFQKIMIDTAVRKQADLVYCDVLYKCGSEVNGWKPYTVLDAMPRMGKIDKTNFIIRRELFKGFPPHPKNWRDGALIEQAIRDGAKHAKAPGVLVVHQ